MNNKILLSSVFSLAISLISIAVLFALGGADSAATSRLQVSAPLLAFNAVGLGFSVFGLAGSNPKPVNTSLPVRMTALAGALGIFLNIIAAEIVFAAWYTNG